MPITTGFNHVATFTTDMNLTINVAADDRGAGATESAAAERAPEPASLPRRFSGGRSGTWPRVTVAIGYEEPGPWPLFLKEGRVKANQPDHDRPAPSP